MKTGKKRVRETRIGRGMHGTHINRKERRKREGGATKSGQVFRFCPLNWRRRGSSRKSVRHFQTPQMKLR